MAKLFGAADKLRQSINGALQPLEQVEYEQNTAELRAELEVARFNTAYLVGQMMTPDQTFDLAQQLCTQYLAVPTALSELRPRIIDL